MGIEQALDWHGDDLDTHGDNPDVLPRDPIPGPLPIPVARVVDYETVTIMAASDRPNMVVGQDVTRKRILITASVVNLFIGKRDELASNPPMGMILPLNGTVELKTTEEIYVKYAPQPGDTVAPWPLVSAYIEKEY